MGFLCIFMNRKEADWRALCKTNKKEEKNRKKLSGEKKKFLKKKRRSGLF